ncbi:leucine-rich repeat-containing protein 3B-like isoform X2 [Antennarius striatus]|uniref:leucine-rich repeat-containing protein 3B-like isoform X2 n=1 Tax=Antennarius striatus TaxID=241820 RepID=UPI0035B03188
MTDSLQVLRQETKVTFCVSCAVTGELKQVSPAPEREPDRIMKRHKEPSLLLWVAAVVATNTLGSNASQDDTLVKTFNNKSLQVIPHSDNCSTVTKLVIGVNQITLNEADRLALASYPQLVELHLDSNLVTTIPAKYFTVVPRLTVLSLSRNTISSLDPECFSGLDVLTELDLSHNLLTSLHTHLFRRLSTLQVLNLQENPWNCSCPLLSSEEVKASSVSTGKPQVTCASLESQSGKDLMRATAVCYPLTSPTVTKDQRKTTTEVNIQQSTGLRTTLTNQSRKLNGGPPGTNSSTTTVIRDYAKRRKRRTLCQQSSVRQENT